LGGEREVEKSSQDRTQDSIPPYLYIIYIIYIYNTSQYLELDVEVM
jgi:hypothetical protein